MSKRSKLGKTRDRLQAAERKLKALAATHEQTSRRLQWAERQADNLRRLLGPGTRHAVFFDVSSGGYYDDPYAIRADLRAVLVRYVDGVLQGVEDKELAVGLGMDRRIFEMQRREQRARIAESQLEKLACRLSSELFAELFRRHGLQAEDILANVRESPVGPSPVGL